MAHPFFVPFSRLSYGAFLSHGIWMQFHEFNSERGTWGCGLDAFLFFLSYLSFSYLFSFITAMIWEQPIASMWYEFIIRPQLEGAKGDAFYHSQSAKSVYRDKKKPSKGSAVESTIADIIQNKKRLLEGKEGKSDEENIGNITINRRQRKGSDDTEDLEEAPETASSDSPGSKKLYVYKPK